MKNLLLLLVFSGLCSRTQGQTVAFTTYQLNKKVLGYSTASATSGRHRITMGWERKIGFIVLGSAIAIEAGGTVIALDNSNYGGKDLPQHSVNTTNGTLGGLMMVAGGIGILVGGVMLIQGSVREVRRYHRGVMLISPKRNEIGLAYGF